MLHYVIKETHPPLFHVDCIFFSGYSLVKLETFTVAVAKEYVNWTNLEAYVSESLPLYLLSLHCVKKETV